MPMGMCLPKFDIYPGTVARNCFKNHANLDALTFFKKKFCLLSGLKFTMPDVISFLPDSLSELKKYIQACLGYIVLISVEVTAAMQNSPSFSNSLISLLSLFPLKVLCHQEK